MVCRIHELLCASISDDHGHRHVANEQAGTLPSSGRSPALLGSQSADRSLGADAWHGTSRGGARHRAHRALRRGTASTHATPGSKLPLWVAEFGESHGRGPVATGGGGGFRKVVGVARRFVAAFGAASAIATVGKVRE